MVSPTGRTIAANAATRRKRYALSCGSVSSLISGRWSSPPLPVGVEEPTSVVVASEEVGHLCPKSRFPEVSSIAEVIAAACGTNVGSPDH